MSLFMQLVVLVGVLLVAVVTVAVVYVAGMRTKSPLVLKPLVRLQRSVINPRQLRSAGTPGAYAAVIRHRGRVSGQAYETPVGAVPVEDGFLIALVYGPRTNWLCNVLAARSATIVHDGRTYMVDRPEVVSMRSVEAHFPPGDRRGFHWIGTSEALRLRITAPEESGEAVSRTARTVNATAPVGEVGRSVGTGQAA